MTESGTLASDGNRVAVMRGIEQLEIEQRPIPEPRPGEVLVQARAVGVCGSDVHFFEHGRIGLDVVEPPHVLGHEISGVVVAHGPGVTSPPVGARVAVEPSRPCGACRVCREGRYNLCSDMRYFSAPPTDGAFADFVVVPHDFAYPVPDTMSDDAAALIEPVSVVVHAVRLAGVGAGERVLITGAGPIGLLTAQVARAAGAAQVTVSDVNPTRLALARDMGASRTIDVSRTPLADVGVEVDVVIECSGNVTALPDAIRCVARGGVAAVVGMSPTGDVTLPLAFMQAREIRLVPTFRFANAYPRAIGLVAAGLVQPERIITGHFPLEDTEIALRAGRTDPDSVKAVVIPSKDRA